MRRINGGWHLPRRHWDLSPLLISRRQLEVMRWIAEGKKDAEVAVILGIKHSTVRAHVYRVMERLDCVTPRQAVAEVARMGLI